VFGDGGAVGAVPASCRSPVGVAAGAAGFQGAEGAAPARNSRCVYEINEQDIFQEDLGCGFVRLSIQVGRELGFFEVVGGRQCCSTSHGGSSQQWLRSGGGSPMPLCVQPAGCSGLFLIYFEYSYSYQTDVKGNKTK